MKRAARMIAVCALASACSRGTPDETRRDPRPEAVPFAGKPTAALVTRPDVAALVDALAAEKRIESSHIGAGGTPSRVYEEARKLTTAATVDELVALLGHTSPIVRGYVAQHIAGSVPAHVSDLVPLAADGTPVDDMSGCIVSLDTVGEIVRQALCYSQLPEAPATLIAVHARGGPGAAAALACAAPKQPAIATAIAVDALSHGALPPKERAEYLKALALAPSPLPPTLCEVGRAGAEATDANVLIGAADALGRCEDPASRAALERLAAGRNTVVASHASASIFLTSPAPRPALVAPDVTREVDDRLRARLQSAEGQRDMLPLVETLAFEAPSRLGGALYGAMVTPEATALARRIATTIGTAAPSASGGARVAAIGYLARARDVVSLPQFHRSLESTNTAEVAAAIRGVTELHDKTARPWLEKLTSGSDRWIAKEASDALAKL